MVAATPSARPTEPSDVSGAAWSAPPRWSIPTGEAPVTVRTERTGALSRSRVGNAPYNPAGTTLSRLCGLGFVHAVRDLS